MATSLARELWVALSRGEAPPPGAEAMLEEARSAAAARWPAVPLEPARLAAALARRIRGRDPAAALAEMSLPDVFLAAGCETGDPAALAAFEREILPEVRAALLRREAPDLVEEALQELRARLFVAGERPARIGDYAGKGPLSAFARVAALRIALNLRRAAKPEAPLSRPSRAGAAPAPPPELGFVKARYRAAFKAAFEEAFAGLPLRQRTLLRLQLEEGLATSRLARIYRVDPSTARRWLADARADLLDRTKARLAERAHVSPAEADSLVPVLASQLGDSLRRILGDRRS